MRAPLFGERRKAALEDIAILTGAKLISEDKSMALENASINDLGKAKKITITKDKTTIVAFDDTKELVKERVNKLKREVEMTESEYDKDKINERIAKLAGGVALIKVGAATETEMKYKKLRIEDSLNATKAAIEEGIVTGGGQTLIEISNELGTLIKSASQDLRTGINIVKDALLEPTKQIAKNAGFNVISIDEASKNSDILMLATPDEIQSKLYKNHIHNTLKSGSALAFAHGLNIHYGLIEPREDIDVFMIAPKGPGHTVRSEYQKGGGVPSLISVFQNLTLNYYRKKNQ